MSNTANFDFCVELGIAAVKEIFHLAFKSEERYPHNVGPLTRTFSGREVTIHVRVLDDATDAADLSFADEKHVRFSFPFELEVQVPDAPDPSLSRIVMKARVGVPSLLTSWQEDGEEVLGLSFQDVVAADVQIESLEGLPAIGAAQIAGAIHARYPAIPHTQSLGPNTVTLYDGNRDATLVPPNAATPFEITAAIESPGGTDHVKVEAPIHAAIVTPISYQSYGRIRFWRPIERTGQTITIGFGAEPADPALASQVELDTDHFAKAQIIAQLQPLLVAAVGGFGTITEPAFDDASARALLQAEIAAYLQPRRYPVYSPRSGDSEITLTTPVGFLLVADGVLAILLNRRSEGDHAPTDFLGGGPAGLAVGAAKVDEQIAAAIEAQFPDLDEGGHEVHTDEGDATLKALTVVLENPDEHGQDRDHLWVTGEAEAHIDCWPDPDVSFAGPIYLSATHTDEPDGTCTFDIQAEAGDFDIGQSCCDVLLDLIIPVVGWIMLAITESTIDAVGGALIDDIAGEQERIIAPFPPVINGIAEVTGCLTALHVSRDGFVFPMTLSIRRLDESFEDRRSRRDQPRP